MNILIISLSNIGDVIETTAVVDYLKKSYPQALLDVVVGPKGVPVFAHDERVRITMVYDKHAPISHKWLLIKKLRAENYGLVVDLKKTLIPLFLGRSLLLNYAAGTPRAAMPVRFKHMWPLKRLGIDISRVRPSFFVSRGARERVQTLLRTAGHVAEMPLVLISPGARYRFKRWPTHYFACLIDLICKHRTTEGKTATTEPQRKEHHRTAEPQNSGYTICLIGDERDKVAAAEVLEDVHTRVIDFTGMTTLEETAALMEQARVVITNDSAPLHLAVAVHTPVVALFGATDPARYGPLEGEGVAVQADMDCCPCADVSCNKDWACLRQLESEDVFRIVCEYL